MQDQSAFARIANAPTTQRNDRYRDGTYELRIGKVIYERKRAGDCFIVELEVISAKEKEKGVTPNNVGSTFGIVWNMTYDSSPGNAKKFICAALGEDESTVAPNDLIATISEITSDRQPLKGVRIDGETFRTETKKGGVYVGMNWKHVPTSKF